MATTPNEPVVRRLAAILTADAVGYTTLMAGDELATLQTLNVFRAVLAGLVRQYGGRVVDMVGDNLLAEFPSAVDAVACALDVQQELAERNEELEPARRMPFRIGINVGDLIVDGERIVGDGVNIAARIEAGAEPGGISISGSVLEQIEGKLPVHIVDLGEQSLKNVKKPVHVYRVLRADERADPEPVGSTDGHPAGAVPGFGGRHAVAVLPFRNLSRDEEQEYFVDGLTEDLMSSLAALKIYPIISRSSTFMYKDQTVDPRRIGAELGVHYLVTGSVRRSGKRVRVTAELVDTADARQIWSGRYDRELADFFDLQDELTLEIGGALGPALSQSEIRHAMKRPQKSLDAWDCAHRGTWHLFERTREDMVECRRWARRALELQPNLAQAWSLIAFSGMYELLYQWTDDPQAVHTELMTAAQNAVALDNEDPMALMALGYAFSIRREFARAIEVLERAIALNPSSALAYWSLGSTLRLAGRLDEAIPMVEKAIRLSPQDPMLHEFLFTIASAHFLAERYDEAIGFAHRSLNLHPVQPGCWRVIAAAHAYLGNEPEAAEALAQLLRLAPKLSEAGLKAFMPDDIVARYVQGLRLAGWQG